MNEETKKKIIDWILANHEHHDMHDDDTPACMCYDAQYPYVNSLELEKFIKSL